MTAHFPKDFTKISGPLLILIFCLVCLYFIPSVPFIITPHGPTRRESINIEAALPLPGASRTPQFINAYEATQYDAGGVFEVDRASQTALDIDFNHNSTSSKRNLFYVPRAEQRCNALLAEIRYVVTNWTRLDTKSLCYRDPSGHNGVFCAPAFYILGPQKTGTSDLFHRLERHHRILGPQETKEPHFWTYQYFVRHHEKGTLLKFYSSFFKKLAKVVEEKHPIASTMLAMDATASTLYTHFGATMARCNTPTLIHAYQSDAKLIFIARDPVARTYSDFMFFKHLDESGRCSMPEDFHRTMVDEIQLFRTCVTQHGAERCARDPQFVVDSVWYQKLTGRCAGRPVVSLYALQLRAWLRTFPRDQFLFLRLDMPQKESLSLAFNFLGVPDCPGCSYDKIVQKTDYGNYSEMLPKTRELLGDFFKPWNKEFEEMTGIAF
eukprot:gb/GEZN01006439.1/.p1 GENE.gb/GEZN01006439.1/~~gb/GEZN01006439.1/.p1  ORF type:complete len:437 (-),score=23.47 gb/GEZN01006439.1/:206-1516(-)